MHQNVQKGRIPEKYAVNLKTRGPDTTSFVKAFYLRFYLDLGHYKEPWRQ